MKNKSCLMVLISAACCLLATSAYATNGIYLIGYGAKSRAMGGVGIGYTLDTIGNQLNPAGITSVDTGAMRVDMSLMYFNPRATSTIPDPRNPPNAGNAGKEPLRTWISPMPMLPGSGVPSGCVIGPG